MIDTTQKKPPAKYVSVLASILEKVKQNVKAHDQLLPVAFILNSDKHTMEIVGAEFDTNTSKDFFAETVRQRASRMQADAIAFASEAWCLPDSYNTQEKIDRVLEQYGQVANCPDKIDILMLSLETYEGTWMARAEIKPAKKGRKLSGLSWLRSDVSQGRFAHLLPVRYPTPDEVMTYLAMAKKKFLAAGIDPDEKVEQRTLLEVLAAAVRQAPVQRLTEDLFDAFLKQFQQSLRHDPPPDMEH